MAHYLVTASPCEELMEELLGKLDRDELAALQPFGKALTDSLRNSRRLPNGKAIWEEEDYCEPPLAQERAAVLDRYFEAIVVEPVVAGTGWALIESLPAMFPDLARR